MVNNLRALAGSLFTEVLQNSRILWNKRLNVSLIGEENKNKSLRGVGWLCNLRWGHYRAIVKSHWLTFVEEFVVFFRIAAEVFGVFR